jgi:gamma-glutamylcyclotransferase (GGCT)/AIG2-like uncharacterized protein YtfP
MPLLFSYGTLQLEEVQRSTFGRRLEGHKDELPGFEQASVAIEDPAIVAATGKSHHANVVPGKRESRVSGTVFEVTDAELAAADQYERSADYVRVLLKLATGKQAWVYVDRRTAPKGVSSTGYVLAAVSVICFGIVAGALSHHREGSGYAVPAFVALCGALAALGAWKLR